MALCLVSCKYVACGHVFLGSAVVKVLVLFVL